MDIERIGYVIQIILAAISVLGVLIFILVSKPLHSSKKAEYILLRRLCLVASLLGFFTLLKDMQLLTKFFPYYSVPGFFALYFPDLIFIFFVLTWLSFVDLKVSGNFDKVKERYHYAYAPYVVMLGFLVMGFSILKVVNKEIEDMGAVSKITDIVFTVWHYLYFVIGFLIVMGYIARACRISKKYRMENNTPLGIRLDVFIIPLVASLIVRNIPPLFVVIDSFCATIALILTYLSTKVPKTTDL